MHSRAAVCAAMVAPQVLQISAFFFFELLETTRSAFRNRIFFFVLNYHFRTKIGTFRVQPGCIMQHHERQRVRYFDEDICSMYVLLSIHNDIIPASFGDSFEDPASLQVETLKCIRLKTRSKGPSLES